MTCSRMGLPRKSTNGLGSPADIDLMRVPLPAARIRHWLTFFIDHLPGMTFEIPPETFAPMSKIPGGKNIDSECPVRPTRLSLVTSPFSTMRASGKRQVSPVVPVVNTSPFIDPGAGEPPSANRATRSNLLDKAQTIVRMAAPPRRVRVQHAVQTARHPMRIALTC